MPTSLDRGTSSRGHRSTRLCSGDDLNVLATAALPAVALGAALVLPAVLILPALAVIAVAAGFLLEGARLLRRRRGGDARLRGYAAGLVFAGLAASILADTDGALLALSELTGDDRGAKAGGH
ncbi:MAG: hypothetical protein AB7L90_11205 [Hyphomicrobiaceae bacterium]